MSTWSSNLELKVICGPSEKTKYKINVFLGVIIHEIASYNFCLEGRWIIYTTFAAVTHGLGSHCRNLVSAHQTEEGRKCSLHKCFSSPVILLVFPILSRTSTNLNFLEAPSSSPPPHIKTLQEAKDQHTTKPKPAALSLFLVFTFPPTIEENEPA